MQAQENHYKRWHDGDKEKLVEIFTQNPFHLERVAHLAGRSPASVATKLAEWGYITDELAELYCRTREQIKAMPYSFESEAERRYVAMFLADPLAFLNRDRLDIWITVIKRVKEKGGKYTPNHWQLLPGELEGGEAFRDEDQLIQHGVAADLGGWLAVSPEWREVGAVGSNGAPLLQYGGDGDYGLAEWLNIPVPVACALTGSTGIGYHDQVDLSSLDTALEALYRMRETGNPGQ